MVMCYIKDCKNKSVKGSSIRFFSLPKNTSIANEWLRHCRPNTDKKADARVCSKHFLSSDYMDKSTRHVLLAQSPQKIRKLKEDAIPTLELALDTENSVTIPMSEYKYLKERIKDLEDKLQNHNALKVKYDNVLQKLRNIFSPGQIRCLVTNDRIKWSAEDIAAAISLRCVSPRAYRYLRNTVGIPLPALYTLSRWAGKFDIERGILTNVIKLLKYKVKSFKGMEKLVALSFDEVYLSNKIEIDKKYEQRIGPHNTCQCIMIRGIFGKWKQPIYYEYDQQMTKDILLKVINKLYNAGLTVVSVTCDMGPGNQGLLKEFNIGVEHHQLTWFLHPANPNVRVHVLIDVPHLIKLARNHFLDNGFLYNNKQLTKTALEKLIQFSASDLKLAHKLTSQHLNVQGTQRQKVSTAVQLFSKTVANTIEWLGLQGHLPNENWQDLAYVFNTFNDWFDIFNAQIKFDARQQNAFGVDLVPQQKILDNMVNLIENIKTGKRLTSKMPFQKGILISTNSLTNLYKDLKAAYGENFHYILTSRLNQDCLENFFSYIRGMGASNDHPSGLAFKHRMKWYILGKHSTDAFKTISNTQDDPNETCLSKPLEERQHIAVPENEDLEEDEVMSRVLSRLIATHDIDSCNDIEVMFACNESDLSNYVPSEREENLLKDFEDHLLSSEINDQALIYIAGYIASRYLSKYPFLGIATKKLPTSSSMPEWIHLISKGNLLYPSEDLLHVFKILDTEFVKYHEGSLSTKKNIFTDLANIVYQSTKDQYPQISFDIIKSMSRLRTYIRLRELNRNIHVTQTKKRKMFHFSNVKY